MTHFEGSKYTQVASQIISDIENGSYKPGDMIPSERALIEHFSVSRITIRKAIDELVTKGFLQKEQGKGTFVKSEVHRQNLFALTSCREDILRQGMIPSTKIISAKVIPATVEIANNLSIEEGSSVFQLIRVYSANNIPVNYTITNLPLFLFEGLENIDFSSKSLYETLERTYSVHLTRAVRTVEASTPSTLVATHLELDTKQPVLLFKATTYGIIDTVEYPIECFISHYRSDRFKFYINQLR